MTRAFPPGLAEVAASLDAEAGSFLDGTLHSDRVTCKVCCAPVDGYPMCHPCQARAQLKVSVADRVGVLVYAVEPDSQTYRVLRDYKGRRPGPSHRAIVSALIALGLRGHTTCAQKLAGIAIDGWAVVPSTRGRSTLRDLVRNATRSPSTELSIRFTGAAGEREFRPDHWVVDGDGVPRHALVIDDAWVTGAHAQSVAASLKRAGTEDVSILTIARVLNPKWSPNRTFIHEHIHGGTFDWTRCPWTGGSCPS